MNICKAVCWLGQCTQLHVFFHLSWGNYLSIYASLIFAIPFHESTYRVNLELTSKAYPGRRTGTSACPKYTYLNTRKFLRTQ
jgi:hypothetical protein